MDGLILRQVTAKPPVTTKTNVRVTPAAIRTKRCDCGVIQSARTDLNVTSAGAGAWKLTTAVKGWRLVHVENSYSIVVKLYLVAVQAQTRKRICK